MRLAKRRPEREIRTERLLLRPLREADLDALVAEINDFDIARMTSRVPHPYSFADARMFLALQAAKTRTNDTISLTIEHDGRLIGGISIFAMPYRSELGYWLGRGHWGKGIATEAGAALLAFGFQELRLTLVHCRVFIDNPASARVQGKLGFRRIGFGTGPSLARGADVAHIHSVLTRAGFRRDRRLMKQR